MTAYTILYVDEDLLVANKLAPIPVQPERSGDPSLQELLRDELGAGEKASILEAAHRIDRRASGAVLFARTRKALSTLEADFRARRIDKRYIACVEREPQPSEGRLEHRLLWDKRRNVVRALPLSAADLEGDPAAERSGAAGGDRARGARPARERAILDYRCVGRSDRYFFVEVELITGRHHQIRAQCSAAGFPIRGDIKYGARRSAPCGLIMLHARRLSLAQPRTGARIDVLAPFPEAEPLWQAFHEDADS